MLTQPKRAARKNCKPGAQLVSVLFESRCDQFGFAVWLETRESDEKNSRMNEVLTEDQLSKIFVRGQQDGICSSAVVEDGFIVDTGVEFSNKHNIMAVNTEPFDNLLVDAPICDDFQPVTVSTGYTTSARSTSAANAIAARTPSAVSRGCADKI